MLATIRVVGQLVCFTTFSGHLAADCQGSRGLPPACGAVPRTRVRNDACAKIVVLDLRAQRSISSGSER